MVTDTTAAVSGTQDGLEGILTATSTLANCCDFVWASAKAANVLLDPVHGCPLIVETIVGFVASFAQLFGCQKSSNSESVAVTSQHLFQWSCCSSREAKIALSFHEDTNTGQTTRKASLPLEHVIQSCGILRRTPSSRCILT